MCEDSSGTLWIATSARLLSYDGRKWRTHHAVRTDDFGAGLRFISIIGDTLWALSRDVALGIPMELLHRNAADIGPLRAAKPDPDWEYMAALFTSDPDSILARINRAIRREKRPEYYTRRASALCALGRCRKAWRDIERARTMGDTGSWFMDARAHVMLCRGEYG
jgi:hypothetical protein